MKQELKELIRDVHMAFTSDPGRRVLDHFRRTLGDVDTFDPTSDRATSHNEGKRSVYLWIKNMLEKAEEPGIWEDGGEKEEGPEVEI